MPHISAKSRFLPFAVLFFLSCALTGSALGQEPNDCAYSFTTGNGQNYLQSCVTVHGNVTQFQSPEGQERIGFTNSIRGYEGYGLCELVKYGRPRSYSDYANLLVDEDWQEPVLLRSEAKLVQIARTTSDRTWTLTQTFKQNEVDASLKVTMSLRNNTATLRNIRLLRWVDAVGGTLVPHTYVATFYGAITWICGAFLMQNVPPWTYLAGGYVQTGGYPPDPCDPFVMVVPPGDLPFVGSGSTFVHYLAAVPPKTAIKIALIYRGM